jgi:two-component system chemotaxis response regulator CheY
MKILVADDDPTLRMLMRELLQAALADCEVMETADGQEAWELLDSGKVADVCIFDLRMPRMGGMELVARLRGDDRFKQQKIIVCSGVNERAPILDAVSLGVDGYLLKPFVGDSLPDRVRKLWEKPAVPAVTEALLPMNDVLVRLGTNRETYLRLLKTFTNDVSNIITDLQGDWTPLVRQNSIIRLGSIQSSGRNLGALQLAARAAALEKSVVKNEPAVKVSKLAALEVENKRVMAATARIAVLPDPASPASLETVYPSFESASN